MDLHKAARWARYSAAVAIAVAVLRWGSGWEWSSIGHAAAYALAALWALKMLADMIDYRSRVNAAPRVWTFTLRFTKDFVHEMLCQQRSSPLVPAAFKFDATSQFLRRLKIEEYATHVRFHRWLVGPDDKDETHYEWWDATWGGRWHESSGLRRTLHLWSYSAPEHTSIARVSARFGWDKKKKRQSVELTLWIEHPDLDEESEVPHSDIIFTVPLDPNRVGSQLGEKVFVRGRELDAAGAVPYPYGEDSWMSQAGEGEHFKWSWSLSMQTFDRYL